jgi:hypothetical protein
MQAPLGGDMAAAAQDVTAELAAEIADWARIGLATPAIRLLVKDKLGVKVLLRDLKTKASVQRCL